MNLWQHQTDNQLNNALQVAFDRNQNLNHFMRNFADLVKLPEANKKQIDLIICFSVIELMQIKAQERQIQLIFEPLHNHFTLWPMYSKWSRRS
jgi:two-component system nitrogen regulation sensor histidine kinase NtrY